MTICLIILVCVITIRQMSGKRKVDGISVDSLLVDCRRLLKRTGNLSVAVKRARFAAKIKTRVDAGVVYKHELDTGIIIPEDVKKVVSNARISKSQIGLVISAYFKCCMMCSNPLPIQYMPIGEQYSFTSVDFDSHRINISSNMFDGTPLFAFIDRMYNGISEGLAPHSVFEDKDLKDNSVASFIFVLAYQCTSMNGGFLTFRSSLNTGLRIDPLVYESSKSWIENLPWSARQPKVIEDKLTLIFGSVHHSEGLRIIARIDDAMIL